MVSAKNLFFGILAGVIATLTVHEIIKDFLFGAGYFPAAPWSMAPVDITGIPKIISDALWGGAWGAIFAATLGNIPMGSMTLKGALMGIVGPAILGVFVAVPFIKGKALFLGGNVELMAAVLLILAGFGAVTAWLYGFFNSGCRLP